MPCYRLYSRGIRLLVLCLILFIGAFPFIGAFSGLPCASGKETSSPATLTDDEQTWLKAHPIIRLAPDPEFKPIEFFDQTGHYAGLAADYARLLEQKLGIRFKVVRCANWDDVIQRMNRNEIDVLNAVVKTPQREVNLNFPQPYLKIPSVIIVRKNVTANLTLEMLKGMNIVMISGYGYVDLIRNQYPELKIELVPELKTALRKVSFGMMDAFVGDLATASFYIESEGITNLKLAGETDPPNISGFAVRIDWPEFSGILEKGMAQITEEEKKAIYNRWIHLGGQAGVTLREFKKLMVFIVGAILLMVFGFLFWNRLLKRMVNLRTEDLRKEIEERKRTEQALEKQTRFLNKIIESSAVSMWISDEKGIVIMANPSCLAFFGATEEEMIGKYNLFQDSVIEKEDFMPVVKGVFKKGEPASFVIKYEFGAVDQVDVQNCPHKIIKFVFTPVLDRNKTVTNVIVQAIDLTEIKQAENEKITSQKIAAEHEKLALVGQVAGQMAHDFNNVLGIIMGNTELSLLDCKDVQTKKTFELIYEQTKRGKNLTKNLVEFARDQEPKQEFFKINEKIDIVINLLKKDLEGIEVIKEDTSGMPEILADPGMIEHALVNLLQNAIHATSRIEHPRITLRTCYLNYEVCFEIEDNGCGIPEKHLKHIYEPSFTLKGNKDVTDSYDPSIKGTGYGMANIKKYIEQHKGTISVESEFGSGTKFKISLPVSPSAS